MFPSILLYNQCFKVLPFGDSAFLLKPISNESVFACPAIAEQLYLQQLEEIREIIASEKDIVLRYHAGKENKLLSKLQEVKWIETKTISQQSYKFPVCFDFGLDWYFVETHTRQTREEIVKQLIATPFRMAMYGFIPGFLYLSGLPTMLLCPRKESPRQSVPAGAVGIGGPYLGCYGLSSPGGWQIIGQCPLKLFDKMKMPPMPINVNDLLEIEVVSENQFKSLQNNSVTFNQYQRGKY